MFAKLKSRIFNSKFMVRYFSKYTNNMSYSQYGEDKILAFALKILQSKGIINEVNYLDIGGCFPCSSSNTYFLYRSGAYGVVAEAEPELAEQFKKFRRKDIVLNIGVSAGNKDESLPFYSAEGVCGSFLKENVVGAIEKCGLKSECKCKLIPTKNINNIVQEYFRDKTIFLVSIDVEGLDLEILKSFDFTKNRPVFFCIETAELSCDMFLGRKITEAKSFMEEKRYKVYADTYINTIFIREDILEQMY